MSRALGIDYGEKNIGLAISDEEQKFSFELDIWSADEFFEKIESLISDQDVGLLVVGYPLNMDGHETQKTQEVKLFCEKLRRQIKIPIEVIDERLTSKMAAKIAGREKELDGLAAQILLENYLNKKINQ